MNRGPVQAMVLAAGLGKRMAALSRTRPKPLIEVKGRALVDYTLDGLETAGVTRVTVNLHHQAALLRRHLSARKSPHIRFSDETTELLGTGGGVAAALDNFGNEIFFIANSDVILTGGPRPAPRVLAEAWREDGMDALMLLVPTAAATGYDGPGDYRMAADGALRHRAQDATAPYVYAGLQLVHPRLFVQAATGNFPMKELWDRAEAGGRLFGVRHQGGWFHVGTPAGVTAAQAGLEADQGG